MIIDMIEPLGGMLLPLMHDESKTNKQVYKRNIYFTMEVNGMGDFPELCSTGRSEHTLGAVRF